MKRHLESVEFPLDLSLPPEPTEATLIEFLRRETLRTGRRRLVVGVSGGLDSAVALTLAAKALGPSSVIAAILPYRTSSKSSIRDATRLGTALGVRRVHIDITPMLDAYYRNRGAAGRVRLGNKMARERMSILYDLSAEDALVLGTGNKTELLLGYGTLHGDLACALQPLGDLYKTQVRQLARWMHIPQPILRKPPSADLYPGQRDEWEIGFPYPLLDRLLYFLVDLRGSPEAAARAGFARRMIHAVRERIRRSQYKRCLPVIAKVSRRTVGIDFRYPRDWGT